MDILEWRAITSTVIAFDLLLFPNNSNGMITSGIGSPEHFDVMKACPCHDWDQLSLYQLFD
jgi:hypothetical protein